MFLQKNDVAAAKQFIDTAKAELAAQHQKAAELKSGMDIFNISQPVYKELTQNEKVRDCLHLTCKGSVQLLLWQTASDISMLLGSLMFSVVGLLDGTATASSLVVSCLYTDKTADNRKSPRLPCMNARWQHEYL